MLLLLHLDTFHDIVKLGFHYLLLLIFYHMMHIYIGLHLQNLIHVLSIMIQQNLRSHSLLCCTFYIYLYAHLCCNTHMYILVAVVSGSSCIYNSLFCLISAFLVSCFPMSSICPYQISMWTFFHCFVTCKTCNKRLSEYCIVTLVTYDVFFHHFLSFDSQLYFLHILSCQN